LNAIAPRPSLYALVRKVAPIAPSWLRRMRSWSVGQDLVAQRALGDVVGLDRGIEPQLEVAHELGRDRRVRRQYIVLVALGEARAEPLAVLAIRAQDRHLRAVEAGGDDEPVQRVGLGLAAIDRGDRLRHPFAGVREVERLLARAEHTELLHPHPVVHEQSRRDLLDDAQPEVLEHRHGPRQLDLGVALVERDPCRLVLAEPVQADHERLVRLQAGEAGDVDRRQLRCRVALVVVREARGPCLEQPRPLGHLLGQFVIPRARERDRLGLELAPRHVGEAVRRVDEEVHAHALALVEHVVRGDLRRPEPPLQQLGHARHQRRAVARAREREDQRRAAAVGVAAAEQAHAVRALEPREGDDRPAQVVDRRAEELLLREGVEQRDRRLVVVRGLDQVLGVERLAQLAVQQRRVGRTLGERLRREEAEQPRLADDLAFPRDVAHADVVHPLVAVHRRDRVRLGDEQQVAGRGTLADRRRKVGQRHALRVRGIVEVAQQAEAGSLDDPDRAVRPVVLARAEQHEVAAQQPLEEVGDLVHLVAGVADRAGAGDGDHVVDALGQPLEVGHHLADRQQHRVDRALELGELLVVEPVDEVVVHDRLAPRRLARAATADDAALAVALDPDDRVQQPRHAQAAVLELARDGVHEEGVVVGVGLEHRADRLVPVLLARRVERADRDGLAAARRRELEDAEDLGEQVLVLDALRRVAGQAAQVRAREATDGRSAVGTDALVDQLLQPAGR
jgi:hypothetical protein